MALQYCKCWGSKGHENATTPLHTCHILFAASQPNKRARGDDDDDVKSVNYPLSPNESSSAYSPKGDSDSDLDLSNLDFQKEF